MIKEFYMQEDETPEESKEETAPEVPKIPEEEKKEEEVQVLTGFLGGVK